MNLPNAATPIDWWLVAGIIYLLGTAFFLFRIVLQLTSLQKIFSKGSRTRQGRYIIVHSEKELSPFSFFHYIVVHPARHSAAELKIVLQHEQVHASQWHSADVLLINLISALLWFHPLSWWYKRSVVQNLEFIADKETVAAAIPKKEYQHTLVKNLMGDFQPALANNFYQSLIKKRIVMLNKKPTQQFSLLKISAIVPFLCAFMFFFNVKTQAQDTGIDPATSDLSSDFLKKIGEAPLYIINNKEYSTAELSGKSIQILGPFMVLSEGNEIERFGNRAKDGVIVIKDGEIVENFKAALKEIDDQNLPVKNYYLTVRQGEKPVFVALENNKKEVVVASVNAVTENSKATSKKRVLNEDILKDDKTLYVLNGKVTEPDFDATTIDAQNIESINVLKGKSAIEKYGERASEGAIEIITKDKQ